MSTPVMFAADRTFKVPYGDELVLHPGQFVLGGSLEYVSMPRDLMGYVISRSSWGRLGLVIATATGVHPGFRGCLTLELSNLGEVPILLRPLYRVAQLFLHTSAASESDETVVSRFDGAVGPESPAARPDAELRTIEAIRMTE